MMFRSKARTETNVGVKRGRGNRRLRAIRGDGVKDDLGNVRGHGCKDAGFSITLGGMANF